MALDFHRLNNDEHLFALDESQLQHLAIIFESFTQRTGLIIDPYGDMKLSAENSRTIIAIIDKYVASTNLNADRLKTTEVLGFRGLLHYFSQHDVDFRLKGD